MKHVLLHTWFQALHVKRKKEVITLCKKWKQKGEEIKRLADLK